MKRDLKTHRNRYVFAALFAALIAVSGIIVIPIGVVPIVLKNLFVVLAGLVLGSFYGGVAVLILLAVGILGLPVFVIPGGLGAFLTPLGGYLVGYFFASLTAGLIAGLPKENEKRSEKKAGAKIWIRLSIASFVGFTLLLLCGSLYIMYLNRDSSMSFKAALLAGAVPFIPGDLIKLLISVPLAVKLRPIAARYLNPGVTQGTQNG